MEVQPAVGPWVNLVMLQCRRLWLAEGGESEVDRGIPKKPVACLCEVKNRSRNTASWSRFEKPQDTVDPSNSVSMLTTEVEFKTG